jgi:hypothetical protein
MRSQPVKGRLLAISLFALSMGGTFALFGSVPLVAQLFATRPPQPETDRVQGIPISSEVASPPALGKTTGSFKRFQPVRSPHKDGSSSSRFAL